MKKILIILFLLFSFSAHAQLKAYFVCCGGESGKVLSHANGKLQLMNGYRGLGESFIIHIKEFGDLKIISLECDGGEKGYYLSHANGNIFLQKGDIGDGESWSLHGPKDMHRELLQAHGGERGRFLSHANGKIFLQNGYFGDGEIWEFHLIR